MHIAQERIFAFHTGSLGGSILEGVLDYSWEQRSVLGFCRSWLVRNYRGSLSLRFKGVPGPSGDGFAETVDTTYIRPGFSIG